MNNNINKSQLEEQKSGLEEKQSGLRERKDEEINKELKEDEKRVNNEWGKGDWANKDLSKSHTRGKGSASGGNSGSSMD